MGAKQVLLSADDITYYLLPGGTGEFSRNGQAITDTIFGQTYKSELTGPISWGINANAIYKGYVGYQATIKKIGSPTVAAGEAFTLVSGKTYQINNVAKRVWDRTYASFKVKDNGVDHTVDVVSVDYLFGKVTFASTYTVIGPVTADVTYFPMTAIAAFTGFTLTQTVEPIKDTDIPTLQANGGYDTHSPGLKTVSLDLPSVFSATNAWPAALAARTEYIVEINPDGLGDTGTLARGFFRLMTERQSGAVGALEEESLTFVLSVPYQSTIAVAKPFGWQHGGSSPLPTAIRKALDAFENDTKIYGKYLYDGAAGYKGRSVIASVTLAGGMDTPNTFTVNLSGDGAITPIP